MYSQDSVISEVYELGIVIVVSLTVYDESRRQSVRRV